MNVIAKKEPAGAEPVAWLVRNRPLSTPVLELDAARAKGAEADGYHVTPLYTHPIDTAEVLRLADEYADWSHEVGFAGLIDADKKCQQARAALCRALAKEGQ